jgi:hypothetical protein
MARNAFIKRAALLMAAGAAVFQSGCAIDPDLLLLAGVQLFTEFAIFFTDNAVVALR